MPIEAALTGAPVWGSSSFISSSPGFCSSLGFCSSPGFGSSPGFWSSVGLSEFSTLENVTFIEFAWSPQNI